MARKQGSVDFIAGLGVPLDGRDDLELCKSISSHHLMLEDFASSASFHDRLGERDAKY